MKKHKNSPKWSPNHAIDAYALIYKGCGQKDVGRALGVSEATIITWKKEHRVFRYAIKKAIADRTSPSGVNQFKDYVVGHLSKEARRLWDKINLWAESKSGPEKSRALLANTSQQVRQSLWLHAYMACSFNASRACRMIGVGRDIVDKWIQRTEGFSKMIDEIKWHRNNYFEEALVDLVAKRDVGAVMFANRTQNRDRGYGDALDVKVSGQVNHAHVHTLANILPELSLEARKEIKGVLARKKQQLALKAGETGEEGPSGEVLEAELVENEE